LNTISGCNIYISISYLATHRRISRNKAQAKNFIKKGTGEGTSEKIPFKKAQATCILYQVFD